MRKIVIIILIILIVAIGYQLYKLYKQDFSLRETIAKLNKEAKDFSEENVRLKADIEYFSKPENLEKELRSKLNLKNPGENLIIVVPPKDESR